MNTNEVRLRKPDYDLKAYLQNNHDIYTVEDVYNIHAEVPGHNDEDHWYWILELRDGRFVLTNAWCDDTGWDCHSGGNSLVAASVEEAAMLASDDTSRKIRSNLLAQVRGEQPFGVEVTPAPQ